jgi:uncharacterized protein (TIGR02284 family)
MAADSLKKLHTALVDTRKGYEEAAQDAETPSLKAFFGQMIALKEKDHSELHAGLSKLGEKPDESGSFMSTVHKTVISVRSAVTGLGTNSLGSFVMGEEQILKEYDNALQENATDPQMTAILNRQKQALLSKIAEMKRLET